MNNLWNNLSKELQKKLPLQIFDTWFSSTSIVSLSNDIVTIQVPSKFHKECISSKYLPLLEESFLKICGTKIAVNFAVSLSKNDHSIRKSTQKKVPLPEQAEDQILKKNFDKYGLKKMFTFDNFITGPSNQFAQAAAYTIAENPSKSYNPLFIYGGVGLGKTHLLHAIGHHVLKKNNKIKISYLAPERFLTQLISAIKQQKMDHFRAQYRNVDIILVDDVQFIAGKDRTQEEFFHTFNTLFESEKQIVICSDRFPKDIPHLEERLKSRFQWGLMADIKPPAYETKIAILKKKAENYNFSLPEDVEDLIAKKCFSNVRELEGALLRVGVYSSLNKKPITLSMAKETLKDLFHEKEKVIDIKAIQKEVSNFFHLKVSDLKSKNRNRNIVLARHISMFFCRELTDTSLPEIGKSFGGKDHSSVIHACKKINSEIKTNPDISHKINQLKDIITGKTI